MKCFSYSLLVFLFAFLSCKNDQLKKPEHGIFEYPVPFYCLNDSLETSTFYGIETKKFIYVRDFRSAWLLFDKRIESSQLINVVGLDEYIFIQSDLEKQLEILTKNRKYNRRFINLQRSPWEQ